MKIRNKEIAISKIICYILYYNFAIYLPESRKYYRMGGRIRLFLCKRIFKKCSNTANIERGARFGTGLNVEIGEYSSIGVDAVIPSNTIIGDYVMMGPNCHILAQNHNFKDTETPMMYQGFLRNYQTVIEDDVWIGRNVLMTPGRHIAKGSIIAAGCVLTKDFPEYSIVGGNPGKLIRSRK